MAQYSPLIVPEGCQIFLDWETELLEWLNNEVDTCWSQDSGGKSMLVYPLIIGSLSFELRSEKTGLRGSDQV